MGKSWLDMMSDGSIEDNAEITAPNGEKLTMGQLREAWIGRSRQLDSREKDLKSAQGELANVFGILQTEKVAIEAAREEIRNRQAEIEALQEGAGSGEPNVREMKRIEKLEAEIANLTKGFADARKTSVEMADIYLDDVWKRTKGKYEKDLPEGVTRNDVLKFAVDHSIKDSRGIVDIEAAVERIIEPKRREQAIKDAEERGAKRKEEEMLLKSLGSPSSFQTRDAGPASSGAKKYTNLDSAFEAAAKDASVFFPDQVQ